MCAIATTMPSAPALLVMTAASILADASFAFWTLRGGVARNCRRRSHPSPSFLPKFPHRHQQHHQLQEEAIRGRHQEERPLVPEPNPDSRPDAASLGDGVPYSAVLSGVDALYPPAELPRRNAGSRTDGYWRYVARGEDPPAELTYGEFDVEFFGALLDRAWGHRSEGGSEHRADATAATSDAMGGDERSSLSPWRNKTFCDIGSGAGRLVVAAASLHPRWKLCRGLEILPSLHSMSASIAERCRTDGEERRGPGEAASDDDESPNYVLRVPPNEEAGATSSAGGSFLPMAPVEFKCGSFADPYEYLGDVDCGFVFSSCMPPDLVRGLSVAIGRQCRPGTIIITTEFPLVLGGDIGPLEDDEAMPSGRYEIELLETVNGWCWLTGGESTAYIHRVKRSLWEEYAGTRERPQPSLEEETYRLVKLMEDGQLTDTGDFLRRVRNDMIFNGVAAEFLPHVDEDEE